MSERIRGERLQRIREEHFRLKPLCVRCEARGFVVLATQLDHIVALTNGGKDFDVDDGQNRQGLCDECHKDKTAEDLGHVRRAKVAIDPTDGWPVRLTRGHGEGAGEMSGTRIAKPLGQFSRMNPNCGALFPPNANDEEQQL